MQFVLVMIFIAFYMLASLHTLHSVLFFFLIKCPRIIQFLRFVSFRRRLGIGNAFGVLSIEAYTRLSARYRFIIN
jgi:hypothetical protein